MFSASFCAIFWLKTRGLMPGLAFLNALISRDEGMHVEFAVLLYTRHLEHRLETDEIHRLVEEAVEIELEFVRDALDVRTIGMNATLMSEYVRYVADHLLESLGHPKLYNDSFGRKRRRRRHDVAALDEPIADHLEVPVHAPRLAHRDLVVAVGHDVEHGALDGDAERS